MKSTVITFGVLFSFVFCSCGGKATGQTNEVISDSLTYYYSKGDWKNAAIWLEKAESKNIKNLSLVKAEILGGQGHYDDAIKVVHDALNTPESADNKHMFYNTLGGIYWLKGDKNNAVKSYQEAIKINPNYARPYIFLGELFAQDGETKEAIENYLSAVRLFAEHNVADETITYSTAVTKLDSSNIEGYKYLQYGFFMKKDYEKIVSVGFKIDDLCVKQGNKVEEYANMYFIGMALNKLEKYKEAIVCLKHAANDSQTLQEYRREIALEFCTAYEALDNKKEVEFWEQYAK